MFSQDFWDTTANLTATVAFFTPLFLWVRAKALRLEHRLHNLEHAHNTAHPEQPVQRVGETRE